MLQILNKRDIKHVLPMCCQCCHMFLFFFSNLKILMNTLLDFAQLDLVLQKVLCIFFTYAIVATPQNLKTEFDLVRFPFNSVRSNSIKFSCSKNQLPNPYYTLLLSV